MHWHLEDVCPIILNRLSFAVSSHFGGGVGVDLDVCVYIYHTSIVRCVFVCVRAECACMLYGHVQFPNHIASAAATALLVYFMMTKPFGGIAMARIW